MIGDGPPAEQMGKLFQEFSQASSTTASRYGGDRSWPRHQPALPSDDGRRHRRPTRAWARLDLHDPSTEGLWMPLRPITGEAAPALGIYAAHIVAPPASFA